MELFEPSHVTSRATRRNHSVLNQPYCLGWLNMQGAFCPDVRRVVNGNTPFERLHGKRPTQEFVPFGEKVLAKQVSTDPVNRMNPIYKSGHWLGMCNNSTECLIGTADGVVRARKVRRLEPQTIWDKEAVNNVIGVLWRMTDGRWTADRPEIREDTVPFPPLPFDVARSQRERKTKQDI